MWIWILMYCGIGLGCAGGALYLAARVRRFGFMKKLARRSTKGSWLAAAALVLIAAAILWMLWGAMNMAICLIHLLAFWLLAEGISAGVRRLRRRDFRRYWAGAAALLLCAAWLTMGWVNANHVWQKRYAVETDKAVANLRIALLSDSHMGTTFYAEGFAGHLADVQAQKPDLVVFVGDFVDEGTSRADMIAACRALGELDVPFGIYYVFGNHDKNNYAGDDRAYTGEELAAELRSNGVTVLEDEAVLIDDRFYLIGRRDASEKQAQSGERASMAELTAGLDQTKFSIVLDHQPRDYAAQAESGVDLVLSGHTHGGQLIPLKQLMGIRALSRDDNVYGLQTRGRTQFIVSSGISDWVLRFKTGCRSEVVMIDVQGRAPE